MHATSIGQRLVPLHWRGLCHPIAIYIARCDEQDNFRDNLGDSGAHRKSKSVVYLAFSLR